MASTRRTVIISVISGTIGFAGCMLQNQSGGNSTSKSEEQTTRSEVTADLKDETIARENEEATGFMNNTNGNTSNTKTWGPRGGKIKFSHVPKDNTTDDREIISAKSFQEVTILQENLEKAYPSSTSRTTVSPKEMERIENALENDQAFYYVRYRDQIFELEIIHDG